MTGRRPNVFTIPADADFSATLVSSILSGSLPHDGHTVPDRLTLADWTVLVPTRRAVRTIVTAFAAQSPVGASLLPQIRPVGDADEDEVQRIALVLAIGIRRATGELFQGPGECGGIREVADFIFG